MMPIRNCQTSDTDPNLDSTGECVRATALAVHVNIIAPPGRILRVDRSHPDRTPLPHLAARREVVAPRESSLAATFGHGAQSLVL